MSPRDRSPVRTPSPRQHRERPLEPVEPLQSDFAAVGIELLGRAGATGGREGASPPHSDYPAPSLKMSVKIDFIYEI